MSSSKKMAEIIPITRQQQRAKERKAAGATTTALDKLVAAAKPGMLAKISRRGANPGTDVLIVLTGNSPLNQRFPEADRLRMDQIGVRLAKRSTLSLLIQGIWPDLSEQLAAIPSCGHFWTLLATKEDGRYCCMECDLGIKMASAKDVS